MQDAAEMQTARDDLRRYRAYEAAAENLAEDIAGLKEKLALMLPAAPVAQYGLCPNGGSAGADGVLSFVQRREAVEGKLARLMERRARLEGKVRRMNRTLALLTPEDRRLLQLHYIERRRWIEVAPLVYMTELGAKEKGRRALRAFARGWSPAPQTRCIHETALADAFPESSPARFRMTECARQSPAPAHGCAGSQTAR